MRRRSLEKFVLLTVPFLAFLHLFTQWTGHVESDANGQQDVVLGGGRELTGTASMMSSRRATMITMPGRVPFNITSNQQKKQKQQVSRESKNGISKFNSTNGNDANSSSTETMGLPGSLDSFIEHHHSGPKLQFGANFQLNRTDALIAGKPLNRTVFLSIGIPTVKRDGGMNYLFDTLTSLITNTKIAEKKDVVFVVFLADFNDAHRVEVRDKISAKFPSELDSGLIQVIEAPTEAYPTLHNLPQKFNDKADRIFWRSKQNIDYAFLMLYCRAISEYYMQIEDDVSVATNYMADIRINLKKNSKNVWFYIRFSTLGFIGVFIRSSDLESLANFLLLLYAEMPCDWLIGRWRSIKGQAKEIVSKPALFQHRGYVSSLKGQRRKMIDKTFKDKAKPIKRYRGQASNPPATYKTNMEIVDRHPVSNAYEDLSPTTMFWAQSVKARQYIDIKFKTPCNASFIYILTGKKDNSKKDRLHDGTVQVASGKSDRGCDNFVSIGGFFEGSFDTRIQNIVIPRNMTCMRIVVDATQKEWVAIRNIVIGTQT